MLGKLTKIHHSLLVMAWASRMRGVMLHRTEHKRIPDIGSHLCNHKDLAKLPQMLLRGHLGEELRQGQKCEHFLEKDYLKREKRLLGRDSGVR